jgi:ABC-type branched-subunit amino acid transport system substrate-binding protein
MKKVFILAMITGIICISLAATGWAQPVKIGAVINLTGPASSWGQYHAKGHQIMSNINDVKGGMPGEKSN